MYQVLYHTNGQSHLFNVETEQLAAEWMQNLINLAMVSWVVVFRKRFKYRVVHAIEDKTGKCPW